MSFKPGNRVRVLNQKPIYKIILKLFNDDGSFYLVRTEKGLRKFYDHQLTKVNTQISFKQIYKGLLCQNSE